MLDNIYSTFLTFLLAISISNVADGMEKNVLEQEINNILTQEELVGIVWSTVSGDEVSIGSAGLANLSTGSLMQASQKMLVGSVTKTVLAIGVLRLISEGLLSLDQNVESLLPQLAFDNPWHDSAPITVKNLLEHSAGLDNIRMWQFLNTAPTPKIPLKEAFPSDNRKLLKVRSEPGTQYSYSNMGYTLLAMVVEAVTRTPYEDYLDQQLLDPLGMNDSTFQYVSQLTDPALAMGYFENEVSQTALPSFLRPAGQFTTTAEDMTKLMSFIIDDGVLKGEPFVRPDLMALLAFPDQTDARKAGLRIGHGLAFAARDRHDVVGMCHPGTTIGFQAYICLFPEEDKGFFFSINTDNETADYERFNSLFIDYLDVTKASVASAEKLSMDITRVEGVYLPSPNNMAEFELLDLLFNFRRLSMNGEHLLLQSLQAPTRVLTPLNGNLLRASDRTQASHAIFVDEEDSFYISDGLSTYKRHSIGVILGYWMILMAGLLGLFFIVLRGIFRLLTRGNIRSAVDLLPFINILFFSVPVLLFLNQSFMKFGELTPASFSLAIVSGLLPVTLLFQLFMCVRRKPDTAWLRLDCLASIAVLLFCTLLFYWDFFPIIFWS